MLKSVMAEKETAARKCVFFQTRIVKSMK